jgi:two-component system, NarL family, nitrate/nitrite response regulator NarL
MCSLGRARSAVCPPARGQSADFGPTPPLATYASLVACPSRNHNRLMKLLIVDDHAIVREGLAAMLRLAAPDTQVLQAGDGAEAVALAVLHLDLDAVFLDLQMPGLDGMSAVPAFGKHRPDLPVIVLSSSENPQDVRRALALGALGYVPKSAAPQTLLSALQLVLSGNIYVPPFMLQATAAAGGAGGVGARGALTERQLDVLRLLSAGQSNKEIARTLGLSDKTVKAHVTAIFKALDVVNRTEAAGAARRAELL